MSNNIKTPLTKKEFEDVKKGILGSIEIFIENDFQLFRLEGAIILLMELADVNVLAYRNPPLYKLSFECANKKVIVRFGTKNGITLESHNHKIIQAWKHEICAFLIMELHNLKYEEYMLNFYSLEGEMNDKI